MVAKMNGYLAKAATNLLNDVADHEKGNDGAARVGPLRITAAGWATPREVRRLAVDEDQADLRMRRADRLDRVLDRRCPVERVAECCRAPFGQQEVVQLRVEAEFGARRHRVDSRCP